MGQAGAGQAWQEDVKAYLATQPCSERRDERTKLADGLLSASATDSYTATRWWNFLAHEEREMAGRQVSTTLELPTGAQPGQRAVSLFQLYKVATRLAAKSNEPAYLQLWLGYARHQGCRNPHEARETYKTLKDQNIGGAAESADLYCQWASLEIKAGEAERAAAILKKGLKAGAEPVSKLKAMEDKVKGMELTGKAETTQTRRYTSSQAAAQGTTQQSLLTTFLPTPAPHVDQRRIRDFTTTSQLEVSAGNQATSQQDRPGASDATADISSKAPLAVPSKARAQQGSPKQGPVAPHPLQKGRPAHTSAVAVASLSGTSGASGGSGEATVTLQHNTRVATPATGRTDNSASSTSSINSEQAEAETLNLRQRSVAGLPGEAAPQDARPGLGDEPTVMVNRAVGRLGGALALSNLRQGPRRLGLGGGAARVVMSRSQPTETGSAASEDSAAEPCSSGEKRKAGAEAQAALAKRRPLPEPEVGVRYPGQIITTHSGRPPLQQLLSRGDKQLPLPRSKADVERNSGNSPDAQETLQVMERVERRPMSMGVHGKQMSQGQRQPLQPVSHDGDETVPLINGGLAAKAMKGRQSIAQFHSRPHAEKDLALSEAPTAVLRKPPSVSLTGGPGGKPVDDPEQTLPLSRTASGSIMANAGGQPRAERPRLVAPPPPPQPSVPGARGDAVHAASERPVMGPPPSRPRQPLSSISVPPAQQSAAPQQGGHLQHSAQPQPQQQHASQQTVQPQHPPQQHHGAQQQGQQQHRVRREDENSVVVRGTRYTKLECVGRGGSSKVYKVMAPNRKIYALKRIRLTGRDREAAAGFIDEITLLQRLRGHSNIIQLIDAEVIKSEGLIYMVLEYGDIDLARLLQRHEAAQKEGGSTELDENFIRLYWQQMLQAVHTIHEARIVHSDLKPANFLVVEGQLKLIDFGIAKAISSDTTSIAREAQVGTLNYMSPEAILGGATNIRGGPPMKVGRPSDVWSLGCILYQMVYGHTPFSALAFIQKMHAITDPNHRISMPALRNRALADVIQRCLDRNARSRITMQELLNHPFLRPTAPAAQDSLVGVTKDQLKRLLIQVSTASAGGCPADLDTISEELFKQLSSGQAVNVAGLLKSAARSSNAEPPLKEPIAARGNILSAAAADRAMPGGGIAHSALAQGAPASADARPAMTQPAKSGAGPAHVGLHDIQAGRAALRRIDAEQVQQRKPQVPKEDSLEARLREGLAKFRFDDTAGSLANGENSEGFSP